VPCDNWWFSHIANVLDLNRLAFGDVDDVIFDGYTQFLRVRHDVEKFTTVMDREQLAVDSGACLGPVWLRDYFTRFGASFTAYSLLDLSGPSGLNTSR
jgi:hypothetical protein